MIPLGAFLVFMAYGLILYLVLPKGNWATFWSFLPAAAKISAPIPGMMLAAAYCALFFRWLCDLVCEKREKREQKLREERVSALLGE